ncbi:MAG: N-acetylmannosamine-6-phosphate 2-epimerase [Cellulomonas sp.]
MTAILDQLHHRLVVSVQAYPGEPMRDPDTLCRIAQAAVLGGAAGIRAQGIEDITLIARTVSVPVIGLWKDGDDGVFITPTLRHAIAVADAGADVVALDGTRRPRPDGLTLAQTIDGLRAHGDVLVMADCGSLDDALAAADAGADIIGTTLAGYTGERPKTDGPDLALLDELVARVTLPVMVEGRVHTPAQAATALEHGAFSVCVGTAITHPTTITSWFVAAIGGDAAPTTH